MPQAHQLSTALNAAADTIEKQIPITRAYLVQNGIDRHFADVLLSHYNDVAVAARAALTSDSAVEPFVLDTAGVVKVPTDKVGISNHFMWEDLRPVAQGYAKAALQSAPDLYLGAPDKFHRDDFPCYRDLAPEALDMIQRDCAAAGYAEVFRYDDTAQEGRRFWLDRQDGAWSDYPPVRIYLNDAGKIVFGEVRPA